MEDIFFLSVDDRLVVLDLIHKFYRLVDTGRAGETAASFSAEATLTFGPGSPKPGTIRGGDVVSAMRDRERLADVTTRHAISNISLIPEDADHVSVYYLMTLFRADGGPRTSLPAFVADVDETLVRDSEGWKISGRIVTPVFSRH